jgi:hypothetical protein
MRAKEKHRFDSVVPAVTVAVAAPLPPSGLVQYTFCDTEIYCDKRVG